MIGYLNLAALLMICVWATWCALCPRIRDGIIGKVIFATVALSALAIVLGSNGPAATMTLNISMAAVGMRHMWMRYFWKRIVRRYRCATCPEKD